MPTLKERAQAIFDKYADFEKFSRFTDFEEEAVVLIRDLLNRVEGLEYGLKCAKLAIKGREHTGFIDKLLIPEKPCSKSDDKIVQGVVCNCQKCLIT